MRYLAVTAYDGTSYFGWQIQKNAPSIQEAIEGVLSKILDTKISIFGSGRTDARVHALGQTFHFDYEKEIKDLGKFCYSINCLLPKDIRVLSLTSVSNSFNARLSAKEKTYCYYLNTGKYNIFKRNINTQFLRKLDIEKIIQVSQLFVGKHCFQNFTTKEEDQDGFVRTITSFEVNVVDDVISFKISGNGFMRYMVRMIVGTLIEVGLNKLTSDDVLTILNDKKRNVVSYKAEPNGLFLMSVKYDNY